MTRDPGDFDPRALRRLRFRAGLSQSELGARTVPPVTGARISQLENVDTADAPSPRLFLALAEALGVQPAELEVPMTTPVRVQTGPGGRESAA